MYLRTAWLLNVCLEPREVQFHRLLRNWYLHSFTPTWYPFVIASILAGYFSQKRICRGESPIMCVQIIRGGKVTEATLMKRQKKYGISFCRENTSTSQIYPSTYINIFFELVSRTLRIEMEKRMNCTKFVKDHFAILFFIRHAITGFVDACYAIIYTYDLPNTATSTCILIGWNGRINHFFNLLCGTGQWWAMCLRYYSTVRRKTLLHLDAPLKLAHSILPETPFLKWIVDGGWRVRSNSS